MGTAVRVGDKTDHGGTVSGPGSMNVLIGGKPAALALDMHACSLPPNSHQPTASPFPAGSPTVLINNKQALRSGDKCGCGASVIVGEATVIIG